MIPFAPPTGAEIRAGLQAQVDAELIAAGGSAVDWEHDVALPILVAAFATQLDRVYGLVQAIADAQDPTSAQQQAVDDILALRRLERKPATRSRVELVLHGDPGTKVPAGTQAEGGGVDGRAKWYLPDDVELDANGTATATWLCTVVGPVVATSGVTTIATPVAGLDSIAQLDAARPGRDVETDTQALTRWAQSYAPASGRSIHSLRTALLGLDDVESAVVVANRANAVATVAGFAAIPPRAIGVAIHPLPVDPEVQAEIGQLLHRHGPDGTLIYGTATTVEVVDSQGIPVTYSWSSASDLEVALTVRVAMQRGYRWAPALAAIEDLVETWSLGMGEPSRRGGPDGLETAIGRQVPGVAQVQVLHDGLDADLFPSAVQLIRFTPVVIEEVPDGA